MDDEGIPRYKKIKDTLRQSCCEGGGYGDVAINSVIINYRLKLVNDNSLNSDQKNLLNRFMDKEYEKFSCKAFGIVFIIYGLISIIIGLGLISTSTITMIILIITGCPFVVIGAICFIGSIIRDYSWKHEAKELENHYTQKIRNNNNDNSEILKN
jgi:hypothetical protein